MVDPGGGFDHPGPDIEGEGGPHKNNPVVDPDLQMREWGGRPSRP